MSIKTDQAKRKLAEECQGKEYLIPFEEYLTGICTTDKIADLILAENKKLEKCFGKMKDIARKRAQNGCAYIPPEDGFEIIREYYGITDADLNTTSASKPAGIVDITDFL